MKWNEMKAMSKARDDLGMDNVKVIGRYLIIDNQKYDLNNIPDFLKQPLSQDISETRR